MAAIDAEASLAPPDRASWLDRLAAGQRGHLFPWAPVAVACGIGFWFLLRVEPGPLD